MTIALLLLIALGVVAVTGSLHAFATDGYRREPTADVRHDPPGR